LKNFSCPVPTLNSFTGGIAVSEDCSDEATDETCCIHLSLIVGAVIEKVELL